MVIVYILAFVMQHLFVDIVQCISKIYFKAETDSVKLTIKIYKFNSLVH